MAITWGNTSGDFRLGIDIQVSGTRATIIVYGQSVGYGHDWTYPLTFTGAWSGSKQISFYSGFGQTVTKELHRSSVSFTGTRTYGASISYWNGSSSVSRSVTISNPQPPAAPALHRILRGSDTQHTITWVQSTGRPVTGFVMQRRNWTGDSWGAWREQARLGSGSRSYTDTTTRAGTSYQWRAAAYNGAGQSNFSDNSWPAPTTPAPVTGAGAKRVGNTIVVSWPLIQSAPDSRIEVERKQGSGSWTSLAMVDSSQTQVEDKSPSTTVSQSYRVRQTVRSPHDGGVTLYSGWVTTGAVSVTSRPLAPTITAPSKAFVPAGPVTIEWRHNMTDGSEQTERELTVEFPNGTTRTYRQTGSSSSTVLDFTATGKYTIRARTKGAHPSFSLWSTPVVVTTISKPVVNILNPSDVVSTRTLTVRWETRQKENIAQNSWRVQLTDGAGQQLGVWEGTGSQTSYTLPAGVDNLKDYRLVVSAATGGVWSEPTVAVFSVEYTPPAAPKINVSWDDELGQAVVFVEAGAGGEKTAYINVYRSDDNGVSWQEVAQGLTSGSVVSDYECPTGRSVIYRAVAYTSIGGEAETSYVLSATSDKLWIGAGPGYVQTIGLQYNPEASGSVEAERASLVFDGRTLPVPVVGVVRSQSMKLSGWLLEDEGESLDALLDLIQGDFVTHLVRVPGRSVYGIITGANWDYKRGGAWPVSFTISETEKEAQ